MATPEKYGHINFKPPSGARREAEKALAWRREHGRGATAVGIARARDISNGTTLSPSTVRRMKAYFDRHDSDQKAEGFRLGEKGYPSNGRIAWAAWGGDTGRSWANRVVEQMNTADDRSTETESRSASMQNIERRYLAFDPSANDDSIKIEKRADPTTGKPATYLIGYAAKFGSTSLLLGDFYERISPSAFEIVTKKQDLDGYPLETRGLFNHDPNELLGRFPTTMKLTVDDVGLKYEIKLPETRRDIAELVERGDLKGSSFSFVVAEGGEKWSVENGKSIRLVTRIKTLLDAGPVTYPAYRDSSVAVAKRSYEHHMATVSKLSEAKALAAKVAAETAAFMEKRAFCPTGSGGGVDNSCSVNNGVVKPTSAEPYKGAVTYNDSDDDYVYHVTTDSNADRIISSGFSRPAGAKSTVRGGFYENYSKGKVFFTEKSGLAAWKDNISQHLFHSHDDPSPVAVVRVKKSEVAHLLKDDKVGTQDAGGTPSYYIDLTDKKQKRSALRTSRINGRHLAALRDEMLSFVAERRSGDCGRDEGGKFGSGNKCQAGAGDGDAAAKKAFENQSEATKALGKYNSGTSKHKSGMEMPNGEGGALVGGAAGGIIGAGFGSLAGPAGVAAGAVIGTTLGAIGGRVASEKAAKAYDALKQATGITDDDVAEAGRLMSPTGNPHGVSFITEDMKGIAIIGHGNAELAIASSDKGKTGVQYFAYRADKESLDRAAKAARALGASKLTFTPKYKSDEDVLKKAGFVRSKSDPKSFTKTLPRVSKRSQGNATNSAGGAVSGGGDCGRDGGKFGPGNHCQAAGDGKYMELEKGDHKNSDKMESAQKFIDKARKDQTTAAGKSGGKSDDGGGVQTWSKGEHFPWVVKQVGDDSGHLQAVHPDGSRTEKYPFTNGDSSEAMKKIRAEIDSHKKSKRSQDVVADITAYLRSRRK